MSSLIPGANRPLQLCMRPDLVVRSQTYLGREYWIVKDPLNLKYYRFELEELSILEMLDGHTSLNQIKRRFESRFAPQRIERDEIHRLIGMLYRSSLIISTSRGQGSELLKKRYESERKQRNAAWTNLLAIRFKGINPDRLLTATSPYIQWLFTWQASIMVSMIAICALLLVGTHFDEFCARLPEFQQFFGYHNWIYLALVLGVTKIIHELGHGLACKRFGGECHEMGVMFLVLTPCLYCNVSDSWMLPNKWHRAAIGAAGMYVEILLASICTFLWWFTHPGTLNYLCLNVMFVCSISTLVFNANPLMRYDGYYILSDVLEIPNLRQKSNQVLQSALAHWCLGVPQTEDPFLPKKNRLLFGLYAIAASLYRIVVSLSILWFLYQVFEPYGLQVVGQILAGVSLYCLIGIPLWGVFKFVKTPGRLEQMKVVRLAIASVLVCGLLGLALCLPLPYSVECELQIHPQNAASVYVDVPGTLYQVGVQPGVHVTESDTILQLTNQDAYLMFVELQGQELEMTSRLNALRQRAIRGDRSAAIDYDNLSKTLASLEGQIERLKEDMARLTIRAPKSGTVLPPDPVSRTAPADGQLTQWDGTPLENRNVGAFLTPGILVCRIADPDQVEAVLAIDQTEIEAIHVGQSVDIVLSQLPWKVFRGQIEHISEMDMKNAPSAMKAKSGGGLTTITDRTGKERLVSTMYQANVPLTSDEVDVLVNANGRARIHAGHRTIATRLYKLICQTFRFDLT